jgi:hypothetical protein
VPQSLISYTGTHDMIQDSVGFPVFLLLLIMQIAVTVALIRSRTIQLWVPILFVVGMVVETG